MPGEADRLRRERDFYRRLLALASAEAVEPFLEEALGLLAEAAEARSGYLELRGPDGERWSMATALGDDQVDAVRSSLSSGVLAEALETGTTVETVSALDDERFKDRESVQMNRIEAVLCAPVGEPAVGVVYLQGRRTPAPFRDEDVRMVEDLARHLAPLAGTLLAARRTEADPTRPWRARLKAADFIGRSPAVARVLEQVALVAPLDVDVLLTGASGTGKTELARLIVANSPRAGRPLVELNSAAIPEQLVESELFGALPGSFTGASRRVTGKVEAAEGGTLFLDEVGELPAGAQAKLLQFLQSRTFWPVGADRPSTADVRILAATNVDLQQAVADGRFREDLYWRLCVLPIRMPDLDERPEDLEALASHFVRLTCRRLGLPAARLSPGAVHALHAVEWPGNVRQLANTVQAALIRAQADGARRLTARHLFPDRPADDVPQTWQEATRAFQHDLLARVLAEEGGNVSATARRLDLTRSHLYTLIDGFGLRDAGRR